MAKANPPGPRGHWLLGNMSELQGDPLGFMTRLAGYGDISSARFGPFRIYQLNTPELVQELLVNHRDSLIKNPHDMRPLRRFLGNGLLTNEGEGHRVQRKMMQPAFHMQRIRAYAGTMVDHTRAMLDTWRDGSVRDVDADMMKLTLGIVSKTLFNADVSEAEARAVGVALDDVQIATTQLSTMFFQPPEWLPTALNRRIKAATATFDAIIMRVINERRASNVDTGDLLSQILLSQDEGQRMTDQQVRDETLTLFLAGHETTANALTWSLFLLSQHPNKLRRLQAEIDRVLGDRPATLADLGQLTYNEMVAKEALRLYPPAWSLSPRIVQTPITLGGHPIGKNSVVLVAPYTIHHDERWWPEPERFDPERFSPEREKEHHKYAWLPFGAGPRVCIGNTFALMEIQLVLASIIQRFDVALEPRQRVVLDPQITLGPKYGMHLRIFARNQESGIGNQESAQREVAVAG
jgi:cytochrome P450